MGLARVFGVKNSFHYMKNFQSFAQAETVRRGQFGYSTGCTHYPPQKVLSFTHYCRFLSNVIVSLAKKSEHVYIAVM